MDRFEAIKKPAAGTNQRRAKYGVYKVNYTDPNEHLQEVSPKPSKRQNRPVNRIADALAETEAKPKKPKKAFLANLTEVGNGKRLVRLYGKDLRYVHKWRKWLAWDGRRWSVDSGAEIERRAKDTARSIYTEVRHTTDDAQRAMLRKWAHASESMKNIFATISAARSEPQVAVDPNDLDVDGWLLNCLNGTLDLRTGMLRPASRDDLITRIAPVAFHPEAKCPHWLAHLNLVFQGNQAVIAYIRRLLGYCLTGVIRDHVLPIGWGGGRNGKGVLKDTFIDILGGDYAMEADASLLLKRDKEAHPTGLTDLFKMRFVAASETDEGKHLSVAMVKKLTGGDAIRARRCREDFWEFSPTHKLFLTTNHKPVITERENAIWDRVKLIPFTVFIPPEKRILDFKERLKGEWNEYPGILNWCIEGCLEWQRMGGLFEPDEIKATTEGYRKEEDVVGLFFKERCIFGNGYRVKAKELMTAFESWRDEGGHGNGITQTKLSREIKSQPGCGMDEGRRNYLGIGLLA